MRRGTFSLLLLLVTEAQFLSASTTNSSSPESTVTLKSVSQQTNATSAMPSSSLQSMQRLDTTPLKLDSNPEASSLMTKETTLLGSSVPETAMATLATTPLAPPLAISGDPIVSASDIVTTAYSNITTTADLALPTTVGLTSSTILESPTVTTKASVIKTSASTTTTEDKPFMVIFEKPVTKEALSTTVALFTTMALSFVTMFPTEESKVTNIETAVLPSLGLTLANTFETAMVTNEGLSMPQPEETTVSITQAITLAPSTPNPDEHNPTVLPTVSLVPLFTTTTELPAMLTQMQTHMPTISPFEGAPVTTLITMLTMTPTTILTGDITTVEESEAALISTTTPTTTTTTTITTTTTKEPGILSGRVLYPFGKSIDARMPRIDDGSSSLIPIWTNFILYGRSYNSLYVGTNGLISFVMPVYVYRPAPLPQPGGTSVVAVFWADVDIRVAGEIYYRQSNNSDLLKNATSDVNTYFPGLSFTASWVFVATWDRVAYFSSPSPPVVENTFQVVLISDGVLSFVLMNYERIQWVTPYLQAGFQDINATHFYSLKGNETGFPTFPKNTNINLPGRYAFRVDTFPTNGSCSFQGVFVPQNTTFWYENTCHTKCECTNTSQVMCKPQSCSPAEDCFAAAQFFTCLPVHRQTCLSTGAYLFTTFDARYFKIQRNCTYVLSQSCYDSALPSYLVEAQSEYEGILASGVHTVNIYVYHTGITIYSGNIGPVLINGTWSMVPATLSGGKINVYRSGLSVQVSTDFGLKVIYDGRHHVTVTLLMANNYSTCGLCGNSNSTPLDASSSVTPILTTSQPFFGASGSVDNNEQRCTEDVVAPSCSGQNVALYNGSTYCGIMSDTAGPFASCNAVLHPETFVMSCIYDLCTSSGNHSVLCLSIAVYMAQCQALNITVGQWRISTLCDINCPENSHYELCGGSCQDSCSASLQLPCGGSCFEGCFCDGGFLRSGDECVAAGQCGCAHNGMYYKLGDLVWLSDCSQRCTCRAPGNFFCVNASCNAHQYCTVKDGYLGCQEDSATCVVTGGTHYLTFDRALAHFEGPCSYRIAHSCSSSTDHAFRVMAETQGHPNSPVISQVNISFQLSSAELQLVIGRDLVVWMNGSKMSLPESLELTANISFEANLRVVQVLLGNDIEILYDGGSTLIISTGPENESKLCGLCGNFNGNPGDDKVMPNGTLSSSGQEFGNSWKIDDNPAVCSNQTEGPNWAESNSSQDARDLCGVLTNRSGPFAECHWYENPDPFYISCLYDLSVHEWTNNIRCRVFTSYQEICQRHGTTILTWLSSLNCWWHPKRTLYVSGLIILIVCRPRDGTAQYSSGFI
ncbi:alpha-tectorin-like isoform X2 [Ambystoma mexicanum]|uniref:alpha-tectorin-like isoform X2 n=1 Tax=Ambystoma mexicanum TaxID=8296 RepID=UPI0037E8AF50